MPELPEVETVRRSLLPHVVGRTIESIDVHQRQLRSPVDARRMRHLIVGRRVLDVRRRAKYLLFDFEGESILMVHLGMTGRLGIVPHERALELHDHICWQLDDGHQLRFNDARRFGMVTAFRSSSEATHPRLRRLGLEPLGDDFTGERLHALTRSVRKPIKNYLMDGRRIAGVGNIYACEALYGARIRPTWPAGKLSIERCRHLVSAVRRTLLSAIEQGGTTIRNFENADGEAGYFAVRLRVYGRQGETCRRCRGCIRRIVQAGRSTFYCPGCQR